MPKAIQPDFSATSMLLDEMPVRRAPENPKVAVLDEAEFAPAAPVESKAKAPAGKSEPARPAVEKQSKSLIAGLAARLKPAKKDKAEARLNVEPAPALDAAEMLVANDDDSLLIEPGSGVPDVRKILDKVRSGQKPAGAAAPGQPDVIAAARRAAQAAAEEAGAQKFVQAAPGKMKAPKQSKSIFGAAGVNRRPILLAAAAVLLVVMSYPLVSNLINGRPANPEPAVPAPVVSTPSENESSAIDAAPAAADTTAAETTPVDSEASEAAPSYATDAGDTIDAAATPDPQAATPPKSDMLAPADSTDFPAQMEKPTAATTEGMPKTTDLSVPGAASEQPAAAPVEAAAPKVELPAGLQPASLVEAAKKADPLAYFEIGSRFTDGRGVKTDLAEAAKWYGLAADGGLAPAEYRLANFYEKGTGVERDIPKAVTLYLSAAGKGNASAMHNLAVLYATGAAGAPDFNQAAHWFQEAADRNIRDSQFNLAILYARGNGVPQDLGESYKWFAIAAEGGDQDAAQKRDEVANAMKPDQLAEAKARLALWKPKPLDDASNNAIVPDEWVSKGNTTATVDMKRAIRNIQAILNNNGFDAGKPDGTMGKKTVSAIKAFQKSVGQEPTGRLDDALVRELLKRNKKG
jgi:localization factor PodJL